MSGPADKPLNRKAAPENAPAGCVQCAAPFAPVEWPRSKWTLSGWSPWCPECHKANTSKGKPWKKKPGPKPKGGVAKGGWTNLPIR